MERGAGARPRDEIESNKNRGEEATPYPLLF
jgi:hypothetical protein